MYDELVKQCRDCIDCLCGDCKYEHLQKTGNFVQCMNALLGETADAIEELENQIVELNKMVLKWIPVTERLPDENEDVLIYGEWTGVSGTKYREIWLTDLNSLLHQGYKPIAWMPLPEPPKEE